MKASHLAACFVAIAPATLLAAPAHAGCYDPRKVIQAMATIDGRKTSPVVIAHRGVWRGTGTSVQHPENSRSSLQAADDACVEAVEIDVKSLDDGTPVVMHDFNLGGTTDIWKHVPQGSPFDPVTNKGTNPKVDAVSPTTFGQTRLLEKRGGAKVTDERPPTIKQLYDFYYENKLSTVLVFDIKNQQAAIAIAKILDADERDYSFGTQKVPLRARDITVFKINATVWPNGVWYINDMMREGIDNPPVVMPIWTTNMELALRKLWGVSPYESMQSWMFGESGRTFLTPEINKKQHGDEAFLASLMRTARQAGYAASVFNAVPDWLGGGEYAGNSGIKSDKAFYKATGACCYDLESIFFPTGGKTYDGRKDTADLRGDWKFLYGPGSEQFGVITTDLGLQMIADIEANYQRDTERYGLASWWRQAFFACGRDEIRLYRQDADYSALFYVDWQWSPPAQHAAQFHNIDECKPTADGKLLISASYGGVGILDRATGKLTLFPTLPQAHTLTMIGKDLVAIALSNSPRPEKNGDKIYLFRLNDTAPPTQLSYEALKGAHGLVWDSARQQLYALGSEELAIFRVEVTEARTWFEPVTRVTLPGKRGGHDLAVQDDDLLVATLAQDVMQFDRRTNSFAAFAPMAGLAKVKSVDIDRRDGRIVYQQATESSWATQARFLHPNGNVDTDGLQIYRVRWDDPRPSVRLGAARAH